MTIFHKSTIESDHCPLVVEMTHKDILGHKLFRFEEAWTMDPNCAEVVSGEWERRHGNDQLKLHNKLSRCREKLRSWSKDKFRNTKRIIEVIKSHLEQIQNMDNSSYNKEEEQRLKMKLREL